jgi:hypothetical protein
MKLSYTAIKKAMEISAASLFSLQVSWIIESYSNNVVALMVPHLFQDLDFEFG